MSIRHTLFCKTFGQSDFAKEVVKNPSTNRSYSLRDTLYFEQILFTTEMHTHILDFGKRTKITKGTLSCQRLHCVYSRILFLFTLYSNLAITI